MPIYDKTDEIALVDLLNSGRAGQNPVGKIYLGEKKTNPNMPGRDMEYFRFESRPEVMTAFKSVYGEKPTSLEIILVSNYADIAFETWREKWSAAVMNHRCDGRTTNMRFDESRGAYIRDSIPCPGGCKQVGRLTFVLPKLAFEGFTGVVTLETHSDHNIRHIWGVLKYNEARGVALSEMIWTLYRQAAQISVPMDKDNPGKRTRATKHLVYLEPNVAYTKKRLAITMRGAGIVIDGYALEPGEMELDTPLLNSGVIPTAPDPDDFESDDDFLDAVATEVHAPVVAPAPVVQPVAKPPKQVATKAPELTLAFFEGKTTSKGTVYLDMTQAQLLQVKELATSEELKSWADFLLNCPADQASLDAFSAVIAQAKAINEQKGSEVIPVLDLGPDPKRIEVREIANQIAGYIEDEPPF